uniref:(northern house mosquito) hypothetical protein n=1 Tax=Culex pipiens TaxID=7175 RepID=A0A8D8FF12_CULPI
MCFLWAVREPGARFSRLSPFATLKNFGEHCEIGDHGTTEQDADVRENRNQFHPDVATVKQADQRKKMADDEVSKRRFNGQDCTSPWSLLLIRHLHVSRLQTEARRRNVSGLCSRPTASGSALRRMWFVWDPSR